MSVNILKEISAELSENSKNDPGDTDNSEDFEEKFKNVIVKIYGTSVSAEEFKNNFLNGV